MWRSVKTGFFISMVISWQWNYLKHWCWVFKKIFISCNRFLNINYWFTLYKIIFFGCISRKLITMEVNWWIIPNLFSEKPVLTVQSEITGFIEYGLNWCNQTGYFQRDIWRHDWSLAADQWETSSNKQIRFKPHSCCEISSVTPASGVLK